MVLVVLSTKFPIPPAILLKYPYFGNKGTSKPPMQNASSTNTISSGKGVNPRMIGLSAKAGHTCACLPHSKLSTCRVPTGNKVGAAGVPDPCYLSGFESHLAPRPALLIADTYFRTDYYLYYFAVSTIPVSLDTRVTSPTTKNKILLVGSPSACSIRSVPGATTRPEIVKAQLKLSARP
ncbi:hypothetical protein MCOR27_002537 [Pyricularia oryzae]|nr:hypothetical protein MCOR01_001321 [Pyricularia oryzae]KAI6284981.1 hypothetical protein MCOR27_002537 [Pyricularia oryzae]KAI6385083.1 hypothetical protein MCOR32_001682 [Pyricularia oryzae]KAI6426086.1 hypothetical protein MCOR24_002923 [Pyricularia oryzae]KAI6538719.1 hypothetical protein MCOR10_001326 [Pyricularia oryzae]